MNVDVQEKNNQREWILHYLCSIQFKNLNCTFRTIKGTWPYFHDINTSRRDTRDTRRDT